jgi:beta-glucosidase
MKLVLNLLGFVFVVGVCTAEPPISQPHWNDQNQNGKKEVYQDPRQPIEKRVEDLLGRMTLEEKIGQLVQIEAKPDMANSQDEFLRQGRIGSLLGSQAIEKPGLLNRLQRISVEESRLGIPLIIGHDTIHGFRTIFPIPLAQACAWEPALFERTQTISARESAAVGIHWAFAPMVDLARDPRGGRIAEGFGEDPWLGSLDTAACVRGFQGTNTADPDRLVACLKHYVGYGAAEGGRDYNTTEISEYTLRNFYLPQFKAGVAAGAGTVMSGFNLLSAAPASANHHTLTEILRGEWKFQGFVVSDWGSVQELIAHGVAADGAEAARLALTAGVDMEMLSTNYRATLGRQVKDGKVKVTVIDEAVRRVLRVKFAKGLFEKPYVDENMCHHAFLKPDALALAREAAANSCVLLKNNNHLLPLSRRIKSFALIGPFADDGRNLLGCWSGRGRAEDTVSLATGLGAKLAPGVALTVVRGCEPAEGWQLIPQLDGTKIFEHHASSGHESDIPKAVAAARAADIIIMALGEPASWSGEDSARSDLGLPGHQNELFDAVAALGKPVIVVLINGRPLALPHLQEKAAAILEAWNPGAQGGNGVADILFGDVAPAGRLTASFPRSVGQVPVYYNHYNTGRPNLGQYVDGPREALYPFGFGLTYTTFEYGHVALSANQLNVDGTMTARVRIKNTGSRPGAEVVQLYIRDLAGSAGPHPVRELKGFQKVQMNPGDSQELAFTISERELGYYDVNGQWLVEPGRFQLWLAKDSASGDPVAFEMMEARNSVQAQH